MIYEQGQQPAVADGATKSSASATQHNNFLSTIKYTLNNSDIPYIDKNHPALCLCEVDNFVITGHAQGYITMWETLNCGKRVINQYLPCIDTNSLNLNWNENQGNIGLQNSQYDITGIMQVNKTVASSLLIVCCFSGELQLLKINGRNRRIDLVHLKPLNDTMSGA